MIHTAHTASDPQRPASPSPIPCRNRSREAETPWGLRQMLGNGIVMSTKFETIEEIAESFEKFIEECDRGYGFGCSFRVCPYNRHTGKWCMETCTPCKHTSCRKLRKIGLADNGQALPPNERPRCGAKTRAGSQCKHPVSPGKRRCRLHGGASSGPKTEEGKKRIAEGQKKRRAKEKRLRSEHARVAE